MEPIFLPEIFDEIFQHLNVPTLAQVVLLSSAYRRAAEQRLYRDARVKLHSFGRFTVSLLDVNHTHRKDALRRLTVTGIMPLSSDSRSVVVNRIALIVRAAPKLVDINIDSRPNIKPTPVSFVGRFELKQFRTTWPLDLRFLEIISQCPDLEHVAFGNSEIADYHGNNLDLPSLGSVEGRMDIVEFFVPYRPVWEICLRGVTPVQALKRLPTILEKSTVPLESLSICIASNEVPRVVTSIAQLFSSLRIFRIKGGQTYLKPGLKTILRLGLLSLVLPSGSKGTPSTLGNSARFLYVTTHGVWAGINLH
ncbi:hypothetical protein BOTBODRAFT_42315 [Botryobasidium botryosum FD-172 SS1]|uniref:F-box domain-containing protein n=1 Tax=Botryobasidium botryosum (strain FD-172 SS1) TaxID=930990 RepID=A0A067MSX7_BOTB1|nr:hypothetical protein BOTBODRAFT_42315 [Botryobasidium botryosum FD-172 SS1]